MSAQGRYKKILVPWDGSGWSRRAIPHAVDIAQNNDSELTILYVFRPPGAEYADQIALAGQEGQIQQLRDNVEQSMTGLAHELRSQGIKVRTLILESTGVASAICDYVRDEDIDLVVMSTHGRTGIARFLFGSVASKVMEEVKVPVLLVHPDKE
ncbi:MAG: universal stress protein [Chloroflexi bacterium]|nr:universal stress protein [Chloroflexota bacterium]MCC6896525.1 universal stress protein [Anaerolineae bacterium]